MEVKVTVSFVSPKKMQELNRRLRGQSYTPVVLSFPYFERIEKQGSRRRRGSYSERKRGRRFSNEVRGSYYEPEEELLLGEVLICKSEAKKLAKKNKVTEDGQTSALIVHGIKHILGVHEKGR